MKVDRNIPLVTPYQNGFFFRKLNVAGYCVFIQYEDRPAYWKCNFHRVRKYDHKDMPDLTRFFDQVEIRCGMVWTMKELIMSDEAMMLMMCGVMNFKNNQDQTIFTHPSGDSITITKNEK